MLVILTWLGKFISGDLLKALIQGYTEKLKAQNTSEKISADLTQAQDQISSQVVMAEQTRWFPFIRWGFALPFMLFNMKIIVYDRMLHLGFTDPLSPDLISLEMVIITAYFGHSAIVSLVQAYKTSK